MNQTYTGRRKPGTAKSPRRSRFAHTLLRQTIAAAICAAVILGIHFLPLHLNRYTEALGRALRYEPDYAAALETCKGFVASFWEKVNPISKSQETSEITEH